MKKSEHNLNVINNFILYFTHDNPSMNCDEMYEAAKQYIAEDHVDGEDMPKNDNVIFSTVDMRNAFIAGEEFESDFISHEMGEVEDVTEPDFGDWIMENYNIEVL